MCGLYEADAFVCLLPTAKAVGYAATAPTGLDIVLHTINQIPF